MFTLKILFKSFWTIALFVIFTLAYYFFVQLDDEIYFQMAITAGYLMFVGFLVLLQGSYLVGALRGAYSAIDKNAEYFMSKYQLDVFAEDALGASKTIFSQKGWNYEFSLKLVKNRVLFYENTFVMYLVVIDLESIEKVEYYLSDKSLEVFIFHRQGGSEGIEDSLKFADFKQKPKELIDFVEKLPNSKKITYKELLAKTKVALSENSE